MPNTRDSNATLMNPLALHDMPSAVSAMKWPADRLTNLTSIATHSVTATYELWSEMLENQKRFTARVLNAMGASAKVQDQPPASSKPSVVNSIVDEVENRAPSRAAPAQSQFPIKRYDTLSVQEIIGKLDRLRDRRSIRTVMAYEAKNKARKGVAAAGATRLKRLDAS